MTNGSRKPDEPDTGEDAVVRLQRDVNEQLVLASLRAEEDAEASKAREIALVETAELREQLVGILGHDLRNPLTAITMSAGLLFARGNLDEADALVVERILKSSNRMTRMIGQVLDLTRSRLGGGITVEKKPTELGVLCRNVADELGIGRGTTIHCVADGTTEGYWDGDRLSQALSNLGGNALDHALPGTPVTFAVGSDATTACVDVTNVGAEIDPDLLPVIFEPFRRTNSSRQKGHLGLGLYIAHQIVMAHAGTIEAASADGTTTFRVRIPLG